MKTKLLTSPESHHFRLRHFLTNSLSKDKPQDSANLPKKFTEEEKKRIVIEGQSDADSINKICIRENISLQTFYDWSEDFISDVDKDNRTVRKTLLTDDDKFRIVLDGLNGQYSIAEICRIENISQDEFLAWSNDFLKILDSKLPSKFQIKDGVSGKRDRLIDLVGKETLEYIESYVNVSSPETIILYKGNQDTKILHDIAFKNIICLNKINDIPQINKYFESINEKMNVGEILIGCLETFTARKERIWANKVPILKEFYFGFEFIVKRIIPKLDFTKEFYFKFTKGKDRLLSKAEGLGRLVSCGFKIMDFKSINGLVYFVVQKEREPYFDKNPSYGPIYAMPRLGRNGKIIRVYKFRTMHPYSEYLQDYMIKAYGYAESGKPANDFRVPSWGKVMRRFWLDELPQLINVLKGEMNLVGIRPVSQRYFQDIPKEMQKLRLTQKPGCIPPYVSLNRSGNVMSVLQSEKEYLEEKIRNPYTTDAKFFLKALYNIIFMHKRSA